MRNVTERLGQLNRFGVGICVADHPSLPGSDMVAVFDDGKEYIGPMRYKIGRTSPEYQAMLDVLEMEDVDTSKVKRVEVETHILDAGDACYGFTLPSRRYLGKSRSAEGGKPASKDDRRKRAELCKAERAAVEDAVSGYKPGDKFSYADIAQRTNVPPGTVAQFLGKYHGFWGIHRDYGEIFWEKMPEMTAEGLVDSGVFEIFPDSLARRFHNLGINTIRGVAGLSEAEIRRIAASYFDDIKHLCDLHGIEMKS